jgi:general secretion pathway protein A
MDARARAQRQSTDDASLLTAFGELERGLSGAGEVPPQVPDVYAPLITIPGQRPLLDLFPVFFPSETEAPPPLATSPAIESPKASPTYEGFFGLNEHPFSLTSDPRFLYHSRAHDRAAQEILSAIGRHDPLVVLTGEPGGGKTILCRTLVEQLDRHTLTSLVTQPFLSIEELLKTLLVDFGVMSRNSLMRGRLNRASRDELTAALREFLTSLDGLQAFAVVIIDDAHNLTSEILQQLGTWLEPRGRLQVILVGEPELRALLRQPATLKLLQYATVQTKLETLEQDEVPSFLFHRLTVAGNPHIEFDDAALSHLSKLSCGVPRLVNLLADRALAEAYRSSISVIDQAIVDTAATALDLAATPSSQSKLSGWLLTGLLFALLLLTGAAVAAYVFRSQLAAILNS